MCPWASSSGLPGNGSAMCIEANRPGFKGWLAVCLFLLGWQFSGTAAAESWQHEQGLLRFEDTPKRVVALNWAAAETLLMLGVEPVGVADRDGYPFWVREPALPQSTHNVGARSAPSLEAIAELKPDLIVTSSQMAPAHDQLSRIAPTYVLSVYDRGADPYDRAREMLLTLGEMLDREAEAAAALRELDAEFARQRQRLENAGLTDRPLILASFMDSRHLRVNASNGLFQAGLERLGLDNAWSREGNFWGFSLVGLERLAPLERARLVVLSPLPAGLGETLEASPFWQHLPMVQQHQVYQIDPVWTFGGLYSLHRLAGKIADALIAGGGQRVDA